MLISLSYQLDYKIKPKLVLSAWIAMESFSAFVSHSQEPVLLLSVVYYETVLSDRTTRVFRISTKGRSSMVIYGQMVVIRQILTLVKAPEAQQCEQTHLHIAVVSIKIVECS